MCKECGAYQEGQNCKSCGRWIPDGARRCGECNSYQDWRRRIPGNEIVLASLTSILTLLGTMTVAAINFLDRPSRTSVLVKGFVPAEGVDPDKDVLVVRANNHGRFPSMIRGATLDLTSVDAVVADLRITNFEGEIPGEGHFDLKLYTDTVKAKTTNENVAALLCSNEVILTFDAEESDLWGNMKKPDTPLAVRIQGPFIRSWITDRLGGDYPKC